MNKWQYNHQARFKLIVQTPLRQRGQIQIQTEVTNTDTLLLLSRLQANPDISDLSPAEIELLNSLGLIAPAEQIPQMPMYHPLLNFEWSPLYPSSIPLDTHVLLEWAELEIAPQDSMLSKILAPSLHLWPKSLSYQSLMPLALEPAGHEQIERLKNQGIQSLSPDLKAHLLAAGLLSAPQQRQAKEAQWQQILANAAYQLSKGYLVLRKIIPAFQIAAIRKYTRALWQEGYFELGSTQVQLRDLIYNETLMQYLQTALTQTISALTGETLQPSYSILALYHEYADLLKHTDRPQCRWNISIVLDTQPTQNRQEAWPLYIEHLGQSHCVQLEMGDLVIYKGTDNPHWRPPLPAGRQVTVGLFHFVPEDFSGSLA